MAARPAMASIETGRATTRPSGPPLGSSPGAGGGLAHPGTGEQPMSDNPKSQHPLDGFVRLDVALTSADINEGYNAAFWLALELDTIASRESWPPKDMLDQMLKGKKATENQQRFGLFSSLAGFYLRR
jgi:hypothetical protein